jgi:pyruvate/2-oxoglutarate dehydrogenase complex dihydrolipoamide acyltransferase (E2) component
LGGQIPLKGVRAIIADRMGTSVHTTARVTLMMEVDVTEFVALRERLKARVSEEWGFAPGYNDLLAKMVANALQAVDSSHRWLRTARRSLREPDT